MNEAKKDTLKRRQFLSASTALGMMAVVPFVFPDKFGTLAGLDGAAEGAQEKKPAAASNSVTSAVKPPAHGSVPVAFVISDGAVVIDFCGPWEVFENVSVPGSMDDAFHLYTVAETTSPIRASGGMKIVPSYTFETAPAPKVIVIPAQNGASDATVEWIRSSTKSSDVTMSVCTGAFVLARTGLLSGKSATTHHSAYRTLAMNYPDIHVKRGARFVEEGNLATAGGLSSGIDLALRVVERYYGHEVAVNTAYQLEYQGQGWMDPNSNAVYAKARVSTEEHPLCPVCEMDVDVATAPKSVYKGKTYYFCMQSHKEMFDAAPDKFV
jgi:putative intracellular protease/amidase/YHS domain-containing protein